MTNRTAKEALERAGNPAKALAEAVDAGKVSMSRVLGAVGLDPSNPTHQAALLACDKYGLDPLLKHLIVIPNAGPYITRDGWLHIAHRSGQLDGIVIDDTGESSTEWFAVASVYRKDMNRPFTYRGRYPKAGKNRQYGPEMAVKVAEVAALRRAFPVAGVGAYEERWDDTEIGDPVGPVERPPEPEPEALETTAEDEADQLWVDQARGDG